MKKQLFVITLWLVIISVFCGCTAVENDGSSQPQSSQASVSSSRAEEIPDNKPALSGSTIFIYMCGSNLETKQGLAGKNIDDLLKAEVGDDLHIVIQTGGAKTWRSHGIDATAAQRYEIKNGKLQLLDTLTQLNMGEAQTLTDFLSWGQENYSADRNMLILWDHGGGSAKGVCFDENYSFDSLTLTELHTALENTKLKTKFDIIGFDACLMASVETAAVVKDYSNYMVASEEIEPSGGWDYIKLAEAFAKATDTLEVGKAICDSYMGKCKEKDKDLYATLSVFDLSQTDYMISQMAFVTSSLIANDIGSENASTVISAMNNCEKFGGDNSYQGAANMLDLVDFVTKVIEDQSTNAVDVYLAASSFVPYKVSGTRNNARGVSFYFPMVYNVKEIRDYIALGLNEDYNRFLSQLYLNVPTNTVAFSDSGSVSDNGVFTVTLTPESKNYLNHIDYILMTSDADGRRHTLCTDNDMNKDWENMVFRSNFRGISLALDGHRLFHSTVSTNGEYVSFNAPINVNGERMNLRFVFVRDSTKLNGGYYKLAGIWNGYDENGLPDNDIVPLKKGDRVQVITDVVQENGRTIENFSEEFTIGENGGEITELPLDGKTYQYVFVASDLFGNTFCSDMATFEMTKSYDELLAKPLPDGEYAAKVTAIEPYSLAE